MNIRSIHFRRAPPVLGYDIVRIPPPAQQIQIFRCLPRSPLAPLRQLFLVKSLASLGTSAQPGHKQAQHHPKTALRQWPTANDGK